MIKERLEYKQLILQLEEAEQLAAQFSGGYSNNFISAEELHTALSENIIKLKDGETAGLNKLWLWFAPTCDWDTLIREDGLVLGETIFAFLSELKKE